MLLYGKMQKNFRKYTILKCLNLYYDFVKGRGARHSRLVSLLACFVHISFFLQAPYVSPKGKRQTVNQIVRRLRKNTSF